MMQLTAEERTHLAAAFARLNAGDWRAFEDSLWLGFGNGWVPLMKRLEDADCVELIGPDSDEPRITPRGVDLLERLTTGERAAAG